MPAGVLSKDGVLLEDSDASRDLYASSRFGTIAGKGRVRLTLMEAAYLLSKEKITIERKGKRLEVDDVLRAGTRLDKEFRTKYLVFADLRGRGYIVKTALKFGADFRVYDKGVKPGDDHARWIVYPVRESAKLTWYDFSAKNRVAHSTRKRLLIGVVDDEDEVSYWECGWIRP